MLNRTHHNVILHSSFCILHSALQCGWGDSNPHGFRHQILSLARLPLRHIRGFFEGAKVHFFSTRPTAAETVSEFACEPGGSRLGGDASKRRRGQGALPYAPEGTLYRRSGVAGDSPTPPDGKCAGALAASSTDTECQCEFLRK